MAAQQEIKGGRTITQWAPIAGTWEIADSLAKFTGYDSPSFKIGIALSNVYSVAAVVQATVELENTDDGCGRILFGYNSSDGVGFSVGLGGYGKAFAINQVVVGQGSKFVHGLGKKENLKANHPYRVEAQFRGTNVKLSVDGVAVLDHNLSQVLRGDQIGVVAYGEGRVTFTDVSVQLAKPRAFVVMQFTEPYNSLWEEVIKPVAERAGFDAYRADDVFGPGVILQDIVRGIGTSQVIIAEVTPQNPNVYYELGYAHAVGTPTILLAEHPSEGHATLPFDISGFRCIFYDDAIRGKRKVEATLEQHLRSILERSCTGVENGHAAVQKT